MSLFRALLLCGMLGFLSASASAQIKPISDRDFAGFKFATFCAGDVALASWFKADDDSLNSLPASNSCLLPWAENIGALQPYSSARGWVDLNLGNIVCNGEPGSLEQAAQIKPEYFYFKLPQGTKGAIKFKLQVRRMRGVPDSGQFARQGWDDWRDISYATFGVASGIYKIPLALIVKDAGHWVQVRVGLASESSSAAASEYAIDLIWPVSC